MTIDIIKAMWMNKRAVAKEMVRHLKSSFTRVLPYLEVHLVDHCNLNCSGCGHYSQIASPVFTEIDQFERDIKRLSQLFRNIVTIRLMGGEPLLHPDSASFVTIVRTSFPRTDLRFVTNGTLLPRAPAAFWEACRRANATLDLTIYPPFRQQSVEWLRLCEQERVACQANSVSEFFKHMNIKGDSCRIQAFLHCRRRFFCPFLQQGHLHVCSKPALVHHFNQHFGKAVPADAGTDIHAKDATARSILTALGKPVETCKWCTYDFACTPWSSGPDSLHDWYFPKSSPHSPPPDWTQHPDGNKPLHERDADHP